MSDFSDRVPDSPVPPPPAPVSPPVASTTSPVAAAGGEQPTTPAVRGLAITTVLFALLLLAIAAGALYWQFAGRLPAWEVSGPYLLIGMGSALALIGALASFARSRD